MEVGGEMAFLDPNVGGTWYRKKLPESLCQRCGWRRATYEVFNSANASNGKYCGTCSRSLIIASREKLKKPKGAEERR